MLHVKKLCAPSLLPGTYNAPEHKNEDDFDSILLLECA